MYRLAAIVFKFGVWITARARAARHRRPSVFWAAMKQRGVHRKHQRVIVLQAAVGALVRGLWMVTGAAGAILLLLSEWMSVAVWAWLKPSLTNLATEVGLPADWLTVAVLAMACALVACFLLSIETFLSVARPVCRPAWLAVGFASVGWVWIAFGPESGSRHILFSFFEGLITRPEIFLNSLSFYLAMMIVSPLFWFVVLTPVATLIAYLLFIWKLYTA